MHNKALCDYLLAIDQGTTNSRAVLFNQQGAVQGQHEIPLSQTFPNPGWVEQNPNEMFNNTVQCCREVIRKTAIPINKIAAIGISTQRETTLLWDKKTGDAFYPAIVWQDRRTAELCRKIASHPISQSFQEKTGLLLDPYFSLSKILWIFENVSGARLKAERGELLFGTVDTYLLWRLTAGKSHATDASNASRTLLFNIHTQTWDEDILKAFSIPNCILPTVLDNAAHFGDTEMDLLGTAIPIMGMAGDQQAAAIGQNCFQPGMIKATYGTGAFLLLNLGHHFIKSKNKLLTTVLYRLKNKVTYGLEGSIFCAGTTIKWLRDTLHLIQTAAETENIASQIASTNGVYLVPAFTGLGAPYWDPDARGAIFGLTGNCGREHIIRAALESVAYQTLDLINAMLSEEKIMLTHLRVDGGMAVNNWLMQFLADMLQINIHRPQCIETSAQGAAYLAGLGVGLYESLDEIAKYFQINKKFMPEMPVEKRDDLYRAWNDSVNRVATNLNKI